MTTSTVTARRIGDPQHYVEGKMMSLSGGPSAKGTDSTMLYRIGNADPDVDEVRGPAVASVKLIRRQGSENAES